MYLKSAKERGIEWNLTLEQFKFLNQQVCNYCGQPPSRLAENKKVKSESLRKRSINIYNGVDRIDSTMSYSIDNCVPCCTTCNLAKLDSPQEDFLKWVEKVYKFRIKGRSR